MYILILMFSLNQVNISTTTIPGFTSQANCLAAGEKIQATYSNLYEFYCQGVN